MLDSAIKTYPEYIREEEQKFCKIDTLAKDKVVVEGPAITKLLRSRRSFKWILFKTIKKWNWNFIQGCFRGWKLG
jgi:hypothetical protein